MAPSRPDLGARLWLPLGRCPCLILHPSSLDISSHLEAASEPAGPRAPSQVLLSQLTPSGGGGSCCVSSHGSLQPVGMQGAGRGRWRHPTPPHRRPSSLCPSIPKNPGPAHTWHICAGNGMVYIKSSLSSSELAVQWGSQINAQATACVVT